MIVYLMKIIYPFFVLKIQHLWIPNAESDAVMSHDKVRQQRNKPRDQARTGMLGRGYAAEMFLAANKVRIAAAGAIPPLVALLGPHSSAEVQEQAAGALSILAFNDDNKVKIATAGAILPLVALLGHHNSPEVQMRAAGALWYLSRNDDNRVKIRSAGAVVLLKRLMSTPNEILKKVASSALGVISG